MLPVTRTACVDIATDRARKLLLPATVRGVHVEVLAFADHPDRKANEIALAADAGGLRAARTADDLPVADRRRRRGRRDRRDGDLTLRAGADPAVLGRYRAGDEITGSPAAARGDRRGGASPTGLELQSHARRARALARVPAPSHRRRVARAANTDGGTAKQHPDLPRRGTPPRARSAESSSGRSWPSWTSWPSSCPMSCSWPVGRCPPTGRARRTAEIVHEAVDRARRRAPAVRLGLDIEPAVILNSPELVAER